MPKQNLDMAKMTNRQRNKALALEKQFTQEGATPREAEERAWKEASQAGGGKRRKDHSYGGRAKINSSATPKSRKSHVGGAESVSSSRPGRGAGAASRKET
jgi:hypothetical protein